MTKLESYGSLNFSSGSGNIFSAGKKIVSIQKKVRVLCFLRNKILILCLTLAYLEFHRKDDNILRMNSHHFSAFFIDSNSLSNSLFAPSRPNMFESIIYNFLQCITGFNYFLSALRIVHAFILQSFKQNVTKRRYFLDNNNNKICQNFRKKMIKTFFTCPII